MCQIKLFIEKKLSTVVIFLEKKLSSVVIFLAVEITQVIDSIPWVRCASGNVLPLPLFATPPVHCVGLGNFYRTQVYLGSDLWVQVSLTK